VVGELDRVRQEVDQDLLDAPGSPRSVGGSRGSISVVSARPFWAAVSRTRLTARSQVAASGKSMSSRAVLSASIFERSRMSLMMRSRWRAAVVILSIRSRWRGW
jgi:hypothetical protein